ncbi:MAG TPA: 3-hydroxyacyl-ACP dehydratase FabZ family protein [Tepidisphaeraceae bacterium]|jgi:3-hydroxyacyl-[acyl-carrier-protein] dehydratase|nr:3-hydroxyacyl-ACP dehydratase FabZ family protein [Tepidisphaeraceae bacterium]
MPQPLTQTLEQIKALLRRDLKLGEGAIPDDMPFFGTDVDLDSLDILLLMTSIEKQFKVKIPSEAVGKQVFQNVSTLAAYVDDQLAGGSVTVAGAVATPPSPADYLKRLPHAEPFRFVSNVLAIREGDSGEGEWAVTGGEAFFAGHFPGNPIVPGVLIAEALAQLSGLVGADNGSRGGKLAQVDVRFEQAVMPPARIVLRSKMLRSMGELQQFEVSASVGEAVVARGTLTLSRPAGQS